MTVAYRADELYFDTTNKISYSGGFIFNNNIIIGAAAAGVDYKLSFNGETKDCEFQWMEDEGRLDFTFPDDTALAGFLLENSDGSLLLANEVVTASHFAPYVRGISQNIANPGMHIEGRTSAAEDTGAIPLVKIQGSINAAAASTRPVLGVYNYTTNVFHIGAAGKVGINTSSPSTTNGGIDIASGGLSLIIGANTGTTARTNATNKYGKIGGYHYANAEEPVAMINCDSTPTTGTIYIGGGVATMNAATEILFFTAANTITTTGTQRMSISTAGLVTIAGTIQATTLTDGIITWTAAQINRAGNKIELQYGATAGSDIRIGGGGSYPTTFEADNGNAAIGGTLTAAGNFTANGAANSLGNASTDIFTFTGRMVVRTVNDNGMAGTNGTTAEIVWNDFDDKFYGCTAGGTPGTWAAFH